MTANRKIGDITEISKPVKEQDDESRDTLPRGDITDRSSQAGETAPGEMKRKQNKGSYILRALGSLILVILSLLVGLFLYREAVQLYANSSKVHPYLGYFTISMFALLVLSLLAFVASSMISYLRLAKIEHLREGYQALEQHPKDPRLNDRVRREFKSYLSILESAGDEQTRQSIKALKERIAWVEDAVEWKKDIESILLADLDRRASERILHESLNVALATAISPYAILDAGITLWRSSRLLSSIAEVYHVRTGFLGTLRLMRKVVSAVIFADLSHELFNILPDITSRGFLHSLARPIGQGFTTAMLTARVGLAAQREVRPIPFSADYPQRRLKGIFNAIKEKLKDKDSAQTAVE